MQCGERTFTLNRLGKENTVFFMDVPVRVDLQRTQPVERGPIGSAGVREDCIFAGQLANASHISGPS